MKVYYFRFCTISLAKTSVYWKSEARKKETLVVWSSIAVLQPIEQAKKIW